MPKTYDKPNQQLTVPQHFYRPPNSRNWYVRLVPPRHIKKLTGESEFRLSTGQSDLKRARPIGTSLIADKLRQWDSLARSLGADLPTPRVLDQALIEDLCARRLYSWSASDDEDRAAGLSDADIEEIDAFCGLTDKAMRSVLAQGPASGEWAYAVGSVLEWASVNGHDLDVTDPRFPTLVREFAKVEKEAQRLIASRNQGDTPAAPEPARPRLSSITAVFKEHKQKQGDPKYVGTLLHTWNTFVAHCGDIPFDSVTQAHIFAFFESRVRATEKPWSLARAKGFGRRVLREFFSLAKVHGLMTNQNPLDGFETFPSLSKVEESSHKKPRFPFTTKQLNALFASCWYDPNEDQAFKGKMRSDLGARYWVPLIGLLHGNRVREAVQLIASDFERDQHGHLYIQFRSEIDAAEDEDVDKVVRKRRLKNEPSARRVPVHPLLIALGLESFLEQRRHVDGHNALLFPSTLPAAESQTPKLGRAYEQAFLRHVRDRLKFGSGFGNHSFRHQLEDRIREAQAKKGLWPAGMGQQYTGRKRTRAADREFLADEGSERLYGNGYEPASMLPFVQRLDFSDVQVPPAYNAWISEVIQQAQT